MDRFDSRVAVFSEDYLTRQYFVTPFLLISTKGVVKCTGKNVWYNIRNSKPNGFGPYTIAGLHGWSL